MVATVVGVGLGGCDVPQRNRATVERSAQRDVRAVGVDLDDDLLAHRRDSVPEGRDAKRSRLVHVDNGTRTGGEAGQYSPLCGRTDQAWRTLGP